MANVHTVFQEHQRLHIHKKVEHYRPLVKQIESHSGCLSCVQHHGFSFIYFGDKPLSVQNTFNQKKETDTIKFILFRLQADSHKLEMYKELVHKTIKLDLCCHFLVVSCRLLLFRVVWHGTYLKIRSYFYAR